MRNVILSSVALILLLAVACQSATESTASEVGVPGWIPTYPDAQVEIAFEDSGQGSFSFVTEDTAPEVVRFYRDRLDEAGFQRDITPFESEHGRGATIFAHSEDETRGLTLTLTPLPEGCEVVVNFKQTS